MAPDQKHQFVLSKVPQSVIEEMREKLWTFSLSIFATKTGHPEYVGTATCVNVDAEPCLLTAGHVWHSLSAGDFAVSLDAERPIIPVSRKVVCATVVHDQSSEEWHLVSFHAENIATGIGLRFIQNMEHFRELSEV